MDGSLATRLERDERRATVTAFPDGSVDHRYEVFDGDRRLERREAFTDVLATRHSPAFTVRRSSVEPGGHAVNMAIQAALLDEDVTLVGNLDDPVLADLPFETVSMGSPAHVTIYGFDDGDVLMADPSDGVDDWALADLRAATGDGFESHLSADVVFCTNWTSFDALPRALTDLANTDVDGRFFVFDPGSLAHHSATDMQRLTDALDALQGSYDVVLAANGGEMRALERGLVGTDAATGDVETAVASLREDAGLAAAVAHEDDAAVAATPSGTVRVENFEIEPVRHTGGGDRFDAGLGYALARDWPWADALRLANACAARYIATGESATPDQLAAFLRKHRSTDGPAST